MSRAWFPGLADVLVVVALGGVAACHTSPEISSALDGAAPGAFGGNGSGASGGGDGPAGPVGNFLPGKFDGSAGAPLGLPSDASCASRTIQAERVPLDLVLMMDTSGSMTDRTAAGVTKWDAVRMAMSTFVGDPRSAGIGMGLQYFPVVRAGIPDGCTADAACLTAGPCDRIRTCDSVAKACTADAECGKGGKCVLLGLCAMTGNPCAPVGGLCPGGTRQNICTEFPGYCHGRDLCDATAYAKLAVPVATLPAGAAAIQASLTQQKPDGLTPTAAALMGAIANATARAKADATRRVAVVLATDGLPDECAPTDMNGIAALAAAAAKATPPVATFVIGVFSPDPQEQATASANLNALAQAGGTTRAFVLSTGQNVTQQFLTALDAIRTTALACEYKIPATMGGGQADYGNVNVVFTSGAGKATTIGYAKSRAGCSPTNGGWYYDVDPTTGGTPTTIQACDATCAALKADAMGRVDIAVGCKTVLIE